MKHRATMATVRESRGRSHIITPSLYHTLSFLPSLHHTLLIPTITPSHPPHSHPHSISATSFPPSLLHTLTPSHPHPHSITPSLHHTLIIPTVTSTLLSCSLLSTPSLICFNSFVLLIYTFRTDQTPPPPHFYLPYPHVRTHPHSTFTNPHSHSFPHSFTPPTLSPAHTPH